MKNHQSSNRTEKIFIVQIQESNLIKTTIKKLKKTDKKLNQDKKKS